ncbi:hypothetical protein POM88_024814 [Heracleum sosnowskyi]|uniref:Uncharacterized protein n=1 Tax=Heracleum sosnowskyi TaxID=360622 RepID=A0AAD8I5V0_9APIA|nr:hypothetical protein POM88_024814 [Heracleum sosnowskyi]
MKKFRNWLRQILNIPVPSVEAVFLKTRKRKPGRKYKTYTAVMNYRLEKIEKAMAAPGGSSGIDELISDGKSHGPSWLIGRHAESAKVSTTTAPRSTYVQELTAQIKQNLVDEMEAKVNKKVQQEVDEKVNQKVQQNLTWVLKKLGEANPDMKIDLGDLCATISTDNENGTPMTGGPSS